MAVVEAKVVDETHLELAEPIGLPAGRNVVLSVAEADERAQWLAASEDSLRAAYGQDEPEYSLDMLKERNPEFKA